MVKMKKRLLAGLLTVGFLVNANGASACSCEVRLTFESNPSQHISQADFILVAKILSVTPQNVTMSPTEIFKGKVSQLMVFPNADRGVGCNYFGLNKAHVGDRHLLFYAPPLKGKTIVSTCSYSGPVEKSGVKLNLLRKHFMRQ